MTKILVVDDSVLMRKHLHTVLTEAGFNVEIARNGEDCLALIPHYKPDVITLDINMPKMDGLTCLKLIMAKHPTPVIMVSSLTERGAAESFKALEYGAFDYIAKPDGSEFWSTHKTATTLIDKVKNAEKLQTGYAPRYQSALKLRAEQTKSKNIDRPSPLYNVKKSKIELILIGVSTGGPSALQEIITSLPADFSVPIVIAQHMPAKFTSVFAERLDRLSPLSVSEVSASTELKPRNVYIAKGDADIKISKRGPNYVASSVPSDAQYLWHPSVEALVKSATDAVEPSKLLCIQLTGMGNDGANAMASAHKRGAKTIAESEESAVVFGMPRELIALGGADKIVPCYNIAKAILNLIKH